MPPNEWMHITSGCRDTVFCFSSSCNQPERPRQIPTTIFNIKPTTGVKTPSYFVAVKFRERMGSEGEHDPKKIRYPPRVQRGTVVAGRDFAVRSLRD